MKNSIRRIYISKREKLSPEFICMTGDAILNVFKTTFLVSFNKFMAYMPIKNEAPLNDITRYLISNGKTVSVPLTNINDLLTPIIFNDFSNTVLGKYNIPEPKEKNPMDPEKIEVVFVPGVVFDKTGHRIGYGKGCYDRFLADGKFIKIGVCYEFQITSTLTEIEEHDVKMDYLLTEKTFYEV
ncbi:MAG: 5-formyltetrahydrofolate cyclo-ligase [Clostridiales bacterium]|nr:5-formyltetrahydrofolate cyclo-ligase [Clostridiales bacterium]